MEFLDLYDENRNPLNRIVSRDNIDYGVFGYYLIVNVIIINSDNKILLSKRSPSKKTHPLKWECNGGAVSSGEISQEAAVREILEELGIKLDIKKGSLLLSIKEEEKTRFRDIFVFYQDVDLKQVKFIDDEVCDVKYVTIDEFKKMYCNDEIVKTHKFVIENYENIINGRK